MYDFPPGLYTDVRVEKVFETKIDFLQEDLKECRIREHEAAFIRVFDGKRWYYTSTTDRGVFRDRCFGGFGRDYRRTGHGSRPPVVEKFPVSTGEYLQFTAGKSIASIPKGKRSGS